MSATIIDIEDDGLAEVKAGDVKVTIDLYRTHNDCNDIIRAQQGKPASAVYDALAEHLKGLGFPTISHRGISQLLKWVGDRVNEKGGKPAADNTAG